jgi:taurine dioxygenase
MPTNGGHYAHKWRPGDLLLWDNRCTQHARNDFSDAERRLLRRVVVESNDVPFNRYFQAV